MNKQIYKCLVCGYNSNFLFSSRIVARFSSNLSQCSNCQFAQYNNPVWIKQLYTETLPDKDKGVLKRNVLLSFATSEFLKKYYKSQNILDYGAGYGIYVRILRDLGLSALSFDKYCKNLFSQEAVLKNSKQINCITTYELLEHLKNPHPFLNELITKYGPQSIIFSTQLVPQKLDSSWWYLMPDIGQHISFYSNKSLEILADKYGFRYYNFKFIHLFTKLSISSIQFKLLIIYSLLITPFKYLWK